MVYLDLYAVKTLMCKFSMPKKLSDEVIFYFMTISSKTVSDL